MSADAKDGGTPLHQKKVETLIEGLHSINTTLLSHPLGIDEVYIMKVGVHDGAESTQVAKVTEGNREPDIGQLFSLMGAVWTAGKGYGKLISLPEQEGPHFDIVVVLSYNGSEYYCFGNYLNGDFEDLSADPNWPQAEREFIKVITKVVTMVEWFLFFGSSGPKWYRTLTHKRCRNGALFYCSFNLSRKNCILNYISPIFYENSRILYLSRAH
jgi:hypothetical protein